MTFDATSRLGVPTRPGALAQHPDAVVRSRLGVRRRPDRPVRSSTIRATWPSSRWRWRPVRGPAAHAGRHGDHRRSAQRREPDDRRPAGGVADVPQPRGRQVARRRRDDRSAALEVAAAEGSPAENCESESGRSVFEQARRLVTWHYQWIIVNEFLPHDRRLAAGQQHPGARRTLLHPALRRGEHPGGVPGRGYRFGHSLVRPSYRANLAGDGGAPFFGFIFDPAGEGQPDPVDLRGGARAPRRFIGWQTFFDFGGDQTQQRAPEQDDRHEDLDAAVQPAARRHRQRRPADRRCRSAICSGTSPGRFRPARPSPARWASRRWLATS